ncbi:Eco57I restriction-modification methylase domain-containing protein [Fusobacterium polymorphum]
MSNLFNEKLLLEKANEEINLNDYIEKRKIINKWINGIKQKNLDKSKEEELQGEFLKDIFCIVLGAINKTEWEDRWNLQRETKTKIDGQKADGVLGFFDKENEDIRVVIELKGPKIMLDQRQRRSQDTRTPIEQAFGYAPKYGKNCQWVIVSNYKEIRLYRSNDMTEYQVFFLENLEDDLEFKKFIYLLSFNSLVSSDKKKANTLQLSEEYQKKQIEIEKKFYNEYKNIRLHIFENIRKNNPEVDDNVLLEKVQKLLDRFLFICFCEDKGLLPPESYINLVVNKGKKIENIFEAFTTFSTWINSGNKPNKIPCFNGGLFKDDETLNGLSIDDKIFEELKKISDYDFDSDLNVNILGHIFEQSISDIEELKKSISGEEFDKKKSKRKKDGIFYTPKYITKYIVENSIKNWLDDKRRELGEDDLPELTEKDIKHDDFKKNYSKNYRKHIEFWEKYREIVRNIKIVDPACGSGAFLITAFEYLLNYNKYLDDKILDLVGTQTIDSDRTKEILQKNIFGVDLNKESVEITKLSLWLKTANKNKTLASLENNIKCGNSLIDDPKIAGDLAFNWENEFPEVFANGGFDIVIGNPPYVSAEYISEIEKNFYEKNYFSASGRQNLYIIFYEKSINLLRKNGNLGFVTPYTILKNMYYKDIREYILNNTTILEIIDFKGIIVFKDAGVDSIVFLLKKKKQEEYTIKYINNIKEFENQIYDINYFKNSQIKEKKDLSIQFSKNEKLISKILNKKNILQLKEIIDFKQGIITGGNKDFLTKEKLHNCEKVLTGMDFCRYRLFNPNQYIIYDIEKLHRPRKREIFESKEKILLRQTGAFPICMLDDKQYFTLDTVHNGILKNNNFNIKYILALLNSSFTKFIYENLINENGKIFAQVKIIYINELPIINISLEKQQTFIEKVDKMLSLNKELQDLSQKFQRMVLRNFKLDKLSAKLQEWYLLDFSDFIEELKKLKVKLSLPQESEWQEFFLIEKSKAVIIDSEIKSTDKEIDSMVYKLYELTDEEIKIVEE